MGETRSRRFVALAGALLLAGFGFAPRAEAQPGSPAPTCHTLRGQFDLEVVPCPAGVTALVCMAGTVTGFGVLGGAVDIRVLQIAPLAGLDPNLAPDIRSSYVADVFITTPRGVAYLTDYGILGEVGEAPNIEAQLITSMTVVKGGTGIFEGATGQYFSGGFFGGPFPAPGGTVVADSQGELCLAR